MIRSSGLLVLIFCPVNVWEAIIGQGLVDGLLDEVSRLAHLACPQGSSMIALALLSAAIRLSWA